MQRYFCVINASCKVKPDGFSKKSPALVRCPAGSIFLKNLAEAKHRPFMALETKPAHSDL
ncbi:hypothetical protein CGC59_12105 [Capnocytophaga sputigena]|uniref:Uncharacterized protein n=1 Tax=Capnocytophaga sputigena TaxID=1019 RepID=A0A250F5F9_CAPSP|nr:hypothetical protein CGC59_12105 [Capnocytophaga sputigena]AVM49945.1 hypothetical protein C4H12_05405 [Capnocytophaga sp. oral taxon 878]EKY08418.1 hypothetical protein HMPREF9078_00831 [Capnocytophaga sp. oral taxon 380 str. F0488]ERI62637.1 hypothetical protein HMPREF1551_01762 [Capnocytophaga sp. oral taxon 863 str. F0517]QGS17593.1 hypothetical protein FOC45_04705 [Capnocytophaga sp. FDAARGOS_737]